MVNRADRTSQTLALRLSSCAASGTRYGMFACAILARARTSLFSIVAGATAKIPASCSIDTFRTVRSVSAARASRVNAGWQAVKISFSRSSPCGNASSASWASVPSCGSCSRRAAARRSASACRTRSIARRRATVVTQAAGFAGTPPPGHRSTARASASCTASSARVQSWTVPITLATTRPYSMDATCRTAAMASESVLAGSSGVVTSSTRAATRGALPPGRTGPSGARRRSRSRRRGRRRRSRRTRRSIRGSQ